MATTNEPAAVGVYDDLAKAERTIGELRRAGFSEEEIGIIGRVGAEETVPTPREMHQPEGNAIQGFIQGSVLGSIIGLVVVLVIPGIGEVAELGRWFDVVGGVALGAVAGGVLVALASLLFSRTLTRFFAGQLEQGRYIVTVKNEQRKDEAMSVLRQQATAAVKDQN